MEIDLDKCRIAFTTSDFEANNKDDPLTLFIEERFGKILKKFYLVGGSIITLCDGEPISYEDQ